MKLSLNIERLVLDGMAATPAEAARIRAAVEGELHRLFVAEATPGLLRHGGAAVSLPAPTVNLPPSAAPEAIGRQIAGAVHRSLVGQRGGPQGGQTGGKS